MQPPSTAQGSGGFKVTPEMEEILRQPGYLPAECDRGQRLRTLYQQNCVGFDVELFDEFAKACFLGLISVVIMMVESGEAPDLTGTETPYSWGYLTLVVAGSERVSRGPAGCDHVATMRYLLSRGAPPNKEDIVGYTALHHVVINNVNANKERQLVLERLLLQNGADVNHRNRYGEVPIFGSFQNNQVGAMELLMEFEWATGHRGKWLRKRCGTAAPLDGKKCEKCGTGDTPLKMCSKCHAARYCSAACQSAHWPTHKRTCEPFSAANTVAARPCYEMIGELMPTADWTRQSLGIRTDPTPAHHHRSAAAPRVRRDQPKAMVIKVQVPWEGAGVPAGRGALLVYTKKRDFVCTLRREDGVAAYDRIAAVVRARGVGGAKAYFPAELKARDELVVKVGEVLAEQPF